MPVKKCHKLGNKYYCFNKANRTVSVFTEQIYQLNECPEEVLSRFIAEKEDVLIIVNNADVATALSSEDLYGKN